MIARAVLVVAVAGMLCGMGYAAVSFWLDDGPAAEEPTFDPGRDLTLDDVLAAEEEGRLREIEHNGSNIRITICGDPREYRGDAHEDDELTAFLLRQDINFSAGSSGASTRTC